MRRSGHAELLELALQGRRLEADEGSGAVIAIDLAPRTLQRGLKVVPLVRVVLGKGRVAVLEATGCPAGTLCGEAEMLRRHRSVRLEDGRALEDVAELSQVAGPV